MADVLYPEGKNPDVAPTPATFEQYTIRSAIESLMSDGHPRSYEAVIKAVGDLMGERDAGVITSEIGKLDTEWRQKEQEAEALKDAEPKLPVEEGPGSLG